MVIIMQKRITLEATIGGVCVTGDLSIKESQDEKQGQSNNIHSKTPSFRNRCNLLRGIISK